jgi:hypothetical protein
VTTLLVLALSGAPAFAESPLSPQGLVEVLPVGDVVGDGVTPITVHVLALKPDGSPMEDLAVKLKSRDAPEVRDWRYEGGGIYSFQVTAPRVDVASRATVRVWGRTVDKAHKVDVRATVPLVPGPPTALSVSANPADLLSGERDDATLSFRVAGTEAVDPRFLRVRTSLGEIGDVADMGSGRLIARLSVSKVKDPGLALVTVTDARYPDRLYAHATIPVTVKRAVKVKAPNKSSVLLRVAGREFGPADAKGGSASVPDVVLPPGAAKITQVTVVGGQPTESEVDLGLPPARRIALFEPAPSIPADPDLRVSIRALVVGPDGRPDPAARPEITTDAGEILGVTHEGEGVYAATLRPHRSSAARSTARLVVELPGEKGQRDEIALSMIGIRATSVTVEASPDPLGDARSATLVATVLGADGAPVVGRAVDWNLTGATADGLAAIGPDGRVEQKLKTFGGPVEAHVTALTPPGDNPVRSIVLVPVRTWLPADAISSARVLVIALDSYGYPVAGARFRVQVESGDGSIPAEVATDARGIGELFYTAGSGLRTVRIRVYQPGISAVATLLQGPEVLRSVALPDSGTAAMRERAAAWRGVAVMRRVEAR